MNWPGSLRRWRRRFPSPTPRTSSPTRPTSSPSTPRSANASTGPLRRARPATVASPFPVRKDNASQTALVSFADKTEPMAFNYYATGAYMLPRFNTGLVIAASKMKRGYIMDIVDLDTKAQAIEAGAHPRDQKALDGKMEELAKGLE